jgi:glycosyltransferase involved in cell wall biosynthesis
METKLKILIWGRFSTHHFAIRNVVTNICNRLNIDDKNDYTILANKGNSSFFLSDENVAIKNINIDPDSAVKNHLFALLILPFYTLFNKYDIVVFPQITFYLFKTSKIIFYIDDLIEYKLNNQKKFALRLRKYFYRRAAKVSDCIITISKNSKKDIVEILKYNEEKIHVLYVGRDENLKPVDKGAALHKIYLDFNNLKKVENYILYVGYLAHPQKNLLFVLDGIIEFLNKSNFYFILIGPDGKDASLIHEKINNINRQLRQDRILAIGTVNKDVLPCFYSAAACFIFPSLYEGFGMPVIEAMACACPVITSNTSSLKEIAENCALLIDPNNGNELKEALEKVISLPRRDTSFYQEHLKQFTWENHVKKLIELINSISSIVLN